MAHRSLEMHSHVTRHRTDAAHIRLQQRNDLHRRQLGPRRLSCAESLVLRMAPRGRGSFADYDLVPQFEAQMAAAHVGVPIADPTLETEPDWLGAPFILMPRVSGRVIGQLPHLDPWIATLSGHREALHVRRIPQDPGRHPPSRH